MYGNPHSTPIDEEHPKNPVNAYGETKLMLERVLDWYAIAYGWTAVAFRYFNACGATTAIGEDHCPETHIIPLLLETVQVNGTSSKSMAMTTRLRTVPVCGIMFMSGI